MSACELNPRECFSLPSSRVSYVGAGYGAEYRLHMLLRSAALYCIFCVLAFGLIVRLPRANTAYYGCAL
jgi:hypothetical protein